MPFYINLVEKKESREFLSLPDENFTFEYLIVAPLSVNSCRVKMQIASCLNVT